MPVYNTGKFVAEAIHSILLQTLNDFELIIVNDGSTDNSLEVIRSFKDRRIKLIHNGTNAGNCSARNKGHAIATGKYLCAMDSDDVSTLNRLERQFLFMEDNPEVGLSGGGFRIYEREEDIFFMETDYQDIKVMLLRSFCFRHSALIFRHSLLKKYNLRYNERYKLAQDYDLVVICARYFPITNIPVDLYHYRIHDNQISWKYRAAQMSAVDEIRLEQLKFIGIIPKDDELKLHLNLLNKIPIEFKENGIIHKWIDKILSANKLKNYYHPEKLKLFFDALMTEQPFHNGKVKKYLLFKEVSKEEMKADLGDVTFLLIFKIDSNEQIDNTATIVRFLTKHFNTTIKILEADEFQQYFPEFELAEVTYEFIKEISGVLQKNKWINYLLPAIKTPFFSVWDIDTIVPEGQVLEGIEKLRSGNSVMNLPYDGRICYCDKLMSNIFRQTLSMAQIQKFKSAFELFEGWNSCGAVFFADKKRYLEAGVENEKIFNRKIADEDRVKRMEGSVFLISRVNGPIYKLWHPGMKRRIMISTETEINDRKEFLKTCSTVH
ncbi:MAG: glycosyltransferase family 2 protein [Ignavibacteriales bacterium]|nr:MAG: glycosyltransferase family 2 protein [Ignavibacteriales bacterium]